MRLAWGCYIRGGGVNRCAEVGERVCVSGCISCVPSSKSLHTIFVFKFIMLKISADNISAGQFQSVVTYVQGKKARRGKRVAVVMDLYVLPRDTIAIPESITSFPACVICAPYQGTLAAS